MYDAPTASLYSGVLVLVCAYNEGENLPKLFSTIQATCPGVDMLLVDDGSQDNTYPWLSANAERFPTLKVVNRGAKLGLGTAIRDGLSYAVQHGYRLCVNLDADLSHDPTVMPQLIESGQVNSEKTADLVIGSRYVEGGGLENCSWKRVLVSRTVNLLARTLIGWSVRDCSSAYRCYKVQALKSLELNKIDNASYGFLEEILWKIWKNGGVIREFPIVYLEREKGKSKISLHEGWGTLKTLLRLSRFRLNR